jgi:hypothetical protein
MDLFLNHGNSQIRNLIGAVILKNRRTEELFSGFARGFARDSPSAKILPFFPQSIGNSVSSG